jgi:hypothetical protein
LGNRLTLTFVAGELLSGKSVHQLLPLKRKNFYFSASRVTLGAGLSDLVSKLVHPAQNQPDGGVKIGPI